MAKMFSKMFKKPYRKWTIVAVGAAASSRSSGSVTGRDSATRCPRGSRRATAASRASRSTSPPSSRCASRRSSSTRATLVKPGQVVVRMDTVTLDAELAEAKATVAGRRGAAGGRRRPSIVKQQERDRSGRRSRRSAPERLVAERRRLAARARRAHDAGEDDTRPALAEAQAKLRRATQQVEVARANVGDDPEPHRRRDAALAGARARALSPGRAGRGARRRRQGADAGEPGRRLHGDLPAVASRRPRSKIGAEARITVDYEPNRAAAGYVSFVSPEAQFTPKQVETKSEREKLMFRVKIQVPKELVEPVHRAHQDRRARRRLRQGEATRRCGRTGCRRTWCASAQPATPENQ